MAVSVPVIPDGRGSITPHDIPLYGSSVSIASPVDAGGLGWFPLFATPPMGVGRF